MFLHHSPCVVAPCCLRCHSPAVLWLVSRRDNSSVLSITVTLISDATQVLVPLRQVVLQQPPAPGQPAETFICLWALRSGKFANRNFIIVAASDAAAAAAVTIATTCSCSFVLVVEARRLSAG